jgi:hypothetical protein|tara:strand:- start:450 stop:626 length:177 start_codon:yes stop_codon:yes gene_type:complete
MLRTPDLPIKTFRVTFHLNEPMRPRQTRIVKARDEYEAARLVILPANAMRTLNIKEIK